MKDKKLIIKALEKLLNGDKSEKEKKDQSDKEMALRRMVSTGPRG